MIINETRFREMISSPSGPIGRHLAKTGVKIESAAKALVTSERLVRTGRYRSSIAWRLFADGSTLTLSVGSALPIAHLLEWGSPSHQIPLVAGEPWLYWNMPNDRGWMVTPPGNRPIRSVNHPGTRPYMILHRAVASVLRGGTT